MSDHEIQIQANTGSDGIVHLDMDIPTGIIDQNIQLTLSYENIQGESIIEDEFKEIIDNVKPASPLDKYAGTLTLSEDPLTFQKRIRNEW